MISQTRLNDAFGELIYCVALADGMVQEEEIETLKAVLHGHPWAREIRWSFDYEVQKGNRLMDTYEKALETLKENGPHKDYYFLLDVLETIGESSEGMQRKEGQLISNMHKSLRAHFVEYLDENGLLTED